MATPDDLHRSAYMGCVQDIGECLRFVSPDAPQELSGRTALSFAAEQGFCEAVGELLKARAHPDSPDLQGSGPIHHAAFRGHVGVLRQLLEARCSPHALDHSGEGALTSTVEGFLTIFTRQTRGERSLSPFPQELQHAACCELLLRHRCDPLQRVGSTRQKSPLILLDSYNISKCDAGMRKAIESMRGRVRAVALPALHEVAEEILRDAIEGHVVGVLPEACAKLSVANVVLTPQPKDHGERPKRVAAYTEGPVPVLVARMAARAYIAFERRLLALRKVGDFEDGGVPKTARLWQELSARGFSWPVPSD